jgi:hypothetical protein
MMRHGLILASLGTAIAVLSACADQSTVAQADFKPGYLGIETLLLDGELVNFRVAMTGARDEEDVATYARCAAAQYTLIRGFGFVRHVRTNVAVYTVSAALPQGLKTIDAEVTVRDCGAQGIPTV